MHPLRHLPFFTLALLALALGAVPPRAEEQARYEVVDLGTLGGERSQANAINDRGDVVGWAETGEENRSQGQIQHAFLWNPEDGMRDLGSVERSWYDGSVAYDVNNHGVVVGSSYVAFRWNSTEGMVVLPPQSGPYAIFQSQATAINDRGVIVGSRDTGAQEDKAVLWKAGRVRRLNAHYHHGQANDVNDAEVVVGGGESQGFEPYLAFLWRRGRAVRPLSSSPWTTHCHSSAYGINNRGEFVGQACARAFLSTRGRVTYLPILPGDRYSYALSINERGQIVGWSRNLWDHPKDAEEVQRAVLWELGTIYDLNALIPRDSGWQLQEATDINERGQIVGYGLHQGVQRAFLLEPR